MHRKKRGEDLGSDGKGPPAPQRIRCGDKATTSNSGGNNLLGVRCAGGIFQCGDHRVRDFEIGRAHV